MTDRAYARISLDTLTSGSIAKQRARLARAADGEPEWYIDESVSGSKIPFADRPDGSRLLADLRNADRVLVTKIDRAARNVRDLLDLVERIEKAGASIVFVDQNIDTAGPMGRFLLTLLGAIAELEAGIIGERRRESLAQFREEGRHAVGAAPFGLQAAPNPSGRGLVLRPDPEQAALLREAAEGILSGDSKFSWARRAGMSRAAFGVLLRNDKLAGILSSSGDGIRLDPDGAVFTLAEWRKLQTYLDSAARPYAPRSAAGGYGRALRCAECGGRLYFSHNKANPKYSVYRCGARSGHKGASVTREFADAHLESDFLKRFGTLAVREHVFVDSSAARDEAIAHAQLNLAALRDAMDAVDDEDEEDRLFASYREAKRALRQAEAMPTESVEQEIDTGQTFADLWHGADDPTREGLLLRFGPWVVERGWLPIEEKVCLPVGAEDYLAGVDE